MDVIKKLLYTSNLFMIISSELRAIFVLVPRTYTFHFNKTLLGLRLTPFTAVRNVVLLESKQTSLYKFTRLECNSKNA